MLWPSGSVPEPLSVTEPPRLTVWSVPASAVGALLADSVLLMSLLTGSNPSVTVRTK